MMRFDSSSQEDKESQQVVSPGQTPEDIAPSVGTTPPLTLAHEAAAGRRGAAWRLFHWIMENDPRATQAVSSLQDDRLAQNLVEFIALGTWAGKPFVVPTPLRSPYARTRLRTLFVSPSGINSARSERVLLADLHDNRPAVRETAMYILGIMGSTAAVP